MEDIPTVLLLNAAVGAVVEWDRVGIVCLCCRWPLVKELVDVRVVPAVATFFVLVLVEPARLGREGVLEVLEASDLADSDTLDLRNATKMKESRKNAHCIYTSEYGRT